MQLLIYAHLKMSIIDAKKKLLGKKYFLKKMSISGHSLNVIFESKASYKRVPKSSQIKTDND